MQQDFMKCDHPSSLLTHLINRGPKGPNGIAKGEFCLPCSAGVGLAGFALLLCAGLGCAALGWGGLSFTVLALQWAGVSCAVLGFAELHCAGFALSALVW